MLLKLGSTVVLTRDLRTPLAKSGQEAFVVTDNGESTLDPEKHFYEFTLVDNPKASWISESDWVSEKK